MVWGLGFGGVGFWGHGTQGLGSGVLGSGMKVKILWNLQFWMQVRVCVGYSSGVTNAT